MTADAAAPAAADATAPAAAVGLVDPVAEQTRYGGLERWLDDPTVTEVLVNGGTDVWIERHGRLCRVATMRPAAVLTALEHILGPIGRRLDRSSPIVDARLPDGSRVCAAIAPVAVDGPSIAIRRFALAQVTLDAFAAAPVAGLLERLVAMRCNILVSGATSSGKTTLLNALTGCAGPDERIVTLEDVAELRLQHPHVVRLETRPPSADGVGEIVLGDLLRTALRLRPDRLVVGEIRSDEAVDLLQAMNTGHDGSLSTIHANSAFDALARLAALVTHSHPGWPIDAVREHVHRAIDVVVHVSRGVDGMRRVAEVAEVASTVHAPALRALADGTTMLAQPSRSRR